MFGHMIIHTNAGIEYAGCIAIAEGHRTSLLVALTQPLSHLDKVSIGIESQKFTLATQTITPIPPLLEWADKVWQPCCLNPPGNRVQVIDEHLDDNAAPQRPFKRPCLPTTISLEKHDLCAVGMFQHGELFRRPVKLNDKAKDVSPETEGPFVIEDDQLRDHSRPFAWWMPWHDVLPLSSCNPTAFRTAPAQIESQHRYLNKHLRSLNQIRKVDKKSEQVSGGYVEKANLHRVKELRPLCAPFRSKRTTFP